MTSMRFAGVMPAITTPFHTDLSVDHAFLAEHARWLADAGCSAVIALGSLGEGAVLDDGEKRAVLRTLVQALGGSGSGTPVVAAISSASTQNAVALAKDAVAIGCAGLMVLPPYLHGGHDPRETRAHFAAVFAAAGKASCMLYNNPIAYGTDVRPAEVAELAAAHANLTAVKESSGDVRRITAIRALCGDRLALCAGLDDLIVEAVAAGAVGWVAGLVNALPEESVRLFELARRGDAGGAATLYRWFLPLLRLDTTPKFVQLIKLVQSEVGRGSDAVRPPRLRLEGEEREAALGAIRAALAMRR
jgi:4-hydroxy-tetrahydrodipicolinate synthase